MIYNHWDVRRADFHGNTGEIEKNGMRIVTKIKRIGENYIKDY